MSWEEWNQRFMATEKRANELAQREPDPRERRLPVTVEHRVRRARRRLSNAYVAAGRASRSDEQAIRAEDCLAAAEREIELAEELMVELAKGEQGR